MNQRIKMRQKNKACLKSPDSVRIPIFNDAFRVKGYNTNRVQQTQHRRSIANKDTFEKSQQHLPTERNFSTGPAMSSRIIVGKNPGLEQPLVFKGASIPMLNIKNRTSQKVSVLENSITDIVTSKVNKKMAMQAIAMSGGAVADKDRNQSRFRASIGSGSDGLTAPLLRMKQMVSVDDKSHRESINLSLPFGIKGKNGNQDLDDIEDVKQTLALEKSPLLIMQKKMNQQL